MCVGKDVFHNSALPSRGASLCKIDFGSLAYLNFHSRFKRVLVRLDCHISKPIIKSMKRGFTSFTSLALPGKCFCMNLKAHIDVQRNLGRPFDEFSFGYTLLVKLII